MADDVKVNSAAVQTVYQQNTQLSAFGVEVVARDTGFSIPADLQVQAIETQAVFVTTTQASSFGIEVLAASNSVAPIDLQVRSVETQAVLSNNTYKLNNFSVEVVGYGYAPARVSDFAIEVLAERVYLPTSSAFSIEVIADNTNTLPTDTTQAIFWTTPN